MLWRRLFIGWRSNNHQPDHSVSNALYRGV